MVLCKENNNLKYGEIFKLREHNFRKTLNNNTLKTTKTTITDNSSGS